MEAVRAEIDRVRKVAFEMFLPFTTERDNIIAEYWNEGYTTQQIADETGYTRSIVRRMLTDLEIDWRAIEAPPKIHEDDKPFSASL